MDIIRFNLSDNLQQLRHENIIIYWAGFHGKIYKYILNQHGIDVKCYGTPDVVPPDKLYNGLPVYSISKIPFDTQEYTMILALDPCQLKQEIDSISNLYKFKQILVTDETDVMMFCEEYIKNILSKGKVDLSKPTISWAGVIIRNPFLQSNLYKHEFIYQAADLLLPLYNDYTLTYEGPSEMGIVQLNSGDCVIDCGANIGLFSVYAASKRCKVYAFEPYLPTIEMLEYNQQLYQDNITIIPAAVSNYIGSSTLYVNSKDYGSNSLYILPHAFVRGEDTKVEVITLDAFAEKEKIKKINFIKVDIEGAEANMIDGASEILKKWKPKLSICTYHKKDDKKVLSELILKHNPNYSIEHKWKKLFAH